MKGKGIQNTVKSQGNHAVLPRFIHKEVETEKGQMRESDDL